MRHDFTKSQLVEHFKAKTLTGHFILKEIMYPLLSDMSYSELSGLLLKVKVTPNGDINFE